MATNIVKTNGDDQVNLEMSCAFSSSTDSPAHAYVAERLGYRRAYFYDSSALYPDVWGQLYRAADRTERIVLGPAVLVPSNRHVMTNAAAIAGLVDIIGSQRVSVAVGSGRTGRLALGHPPMRWADVADYLRALKALLRGDTISWDGRQIRMMHAPGHGATRPITVEFLVAAAGPKGLAVARELGDGVFGGVAPVGGFDRSPALVWGTVMSREETPATARVLTAAGPAAATFGGHYPIQFGSTDHESEQAGQWRGAYADVPQEELHLELHRGHLCWVNQRDRRFVTGDTVADLGLALDRDSWHRKLSTLVDQGATEIVYQPAGPNIPDELERFAGLFA